MRFSILAAFFLFISFPGLARQQEKPLKVETPSAPTQVELTQEEIDWWKTVEQLAQEAKIAAQTLEAKISRYKEDHKVDNRAEALAKMPVADIQNYRETKEKFWRILGQGVEKKFRVPIDQSRPKVIWAPIPTYTVKGRNNRTCGKVILKVAVAANGMIDSTTVLKSIGYSCPAPFSSTPPKEEPSSPPIGNGLENAAIDAAEEMIFFPAIKDHFFVLATAKVEIFFHIY